MDAIVQALANAGNQAVLVLVLVNAGLLAMLRSLHKQVSDDRKATDQVIRELTQALHEWRVALAERRTSR